MADPPKSLFWWDFPNARILKKEFLIAEAQPVTQHKS